MKRILLLIVVAFISVANVQAQSHWYLVKFTDKDNSTFDLNNPTEFLTQRALDRRTNQGIELNEQDLPITPDYIAQVEATGVTVNNKLKWFNTLVIMSNTDDVTAIESLDFVESVIQQNTPSWSTAPQQKEFFKNESIVASEDIEKNTSATSVINYGAGDNQIKMMSGHILHDSGYTGTGMVIAVLDAGFKNAGTMDVLQPLFNNDQILSMHNFVRPTSEVIGSDNHSHGTSVLSTMGANVEGTLVGTAPDAKYHLLVTEDQYAETILEEYFWVDGAEYADSVGADIINSSLGYTEFDYDEDNHIYDMLDGDTYFGTRGADVAASKGILICNSAGNSGGDSWHYISVPADADSIFTIGAVDGDGTIAYFSSRGPTPDGRIKPNVVAQGQSAAFVSPNSSGGTISYGNGTSFSSPIMAGITACFWQANPGMNNMEVMQAIMEASNNYETPDADYGYGLPNFEEALNNSSVFTNSTEDVDFTVYPNPTSDIIKIKYLGNVSGVVNVEVIDQYGKIVSSFNANCSPRSIIQINDELISGVYFVKMNFDNRVETKRVLVIN